VIGRNILYNFDLKKPQIQVFFIIKSLVVRNLSIEVELNIDFFFVNKIDLFILQCIVISRFERLIYVIIRSKINEINIIYCNCFIVLFVKPIDISLLMPSLPQQQQHPSTIPSPKSQPIFDPVFL